MFYQGKIINQDPRYGSWLTPWFQTARAAATAAEKLNAEKYNSLGTIVINESAKPLIELGYAHIPKYFKYRYFKTDVATGRNKTYVMDSETYDDNLLGVADYRRQVESEHQDNIRGLMFAYSDQAAIGFEIEIIE
jgi:hypothetical protein